MRIFTALLMVICIAAAAQDRPRNLCNFDGFSADPKLAEVTQGTVGYFGCASAKDCLPTKLAANDAVTLYHTDGDWTCAYIQQSDGAGPGWVKSRDLREVPVDPAPPVDAWFGSWTNGRGRIRIAASKPSGKLHLAGGTAWHGVGDVANAGGFEGDAAPVDNRLHFVGGTGSCTVDLTLIGKYLVANDNDRCGGMNVRFWGIWKRDAR